MLVYELKAHLKNLWQINQVGIIEKLKHLRYASRVSVCCLLHESLRCLAKLFLGTCNAILVGCLNKRNEDLSLDHN